MATKAELISQALLKLSGGQPTSDMDVRWGEAETYLAYAVNYVMTGSYWADSANEGEKTLNPMLLLPFNVPVQYDTERYQKYSTLPKRAITLSKGRAIQVSLLNGRLCIPVTQGNSGLQQYYKCYKSEPSYEVESPTRINWHVIDAIIDTVRVRCMVHVQDLDDDDEVVLPSDGDTKVVDLMVQFLLGQKQLPKDNIEDGKDNNAA
jgi:hypothetical protein